MRTLLLLLCLGCPAWAQLITVDAGQGMVGEPTGGTVGLDFGRWATDGSLGLYNGSIVGGANVRWQFNRKWSALAGDQSVGVGIPVESGFTSGVLTRGLSLTYAPNPATRVSLFGGMAGGGNISSDVLFFTPQIALGALSFDRYLGPGGHFRFFGRALFSNRQTILGGGLYQTKRLEAGLSAGIGSNQPHAEALLNYLDKQWSLRSGYLYSGSKFQLLTLPQFRYAQEDRGNLELKWTPGKYDSLTLAHHQYLEPPLPGALLPVVTRGSTEQAGGTLSLAGVEVGTTLFQSLFEGKYASAGSFLASLRPGRLLVFNANYYRPLHSAHSMPILSFNTEQKVNRRLKFSEFATHSNRQWTVNYGGALRWDRFDINTGYATYFAPLASGGGRFTQEMNLSGHLQLGRWQCGVQSYVQPDGRVLYSYEVKTFYFHPTAAGPVQAPHSAAIALPRYLIVGQVVLETTGKPVALVPVRIGDDLLYTDETGAFSLRTPRRRPRTIQLLLERQIGSHFYQQVSGPAEVAPGDDAAPGQAQFVVRVNATKKAKPPVGAIVITRPVSTP